MSKGTLRHTGVKPPVTSSTPSLLTLRPFVRAHKSVQLCRIPRGNIISAFGKSHAGVRIWLPKTPPVFL